MDTLHLPLSSLHQPAQQVTSLLRRGWTGVRAVWHDATLSADERYLAAAADHADLERRLRALESHGLR